MSRARHQEPAKFQKTRFCSAARSCMLETRRDCAGQVVWFVAKPQAEPWLPRPDKSILLLIEINSFHCVAIGKHQAQRFLNLDLLSGIVAIQVLHKMHASLLV